MRPTHFPELHPRAIALILEFVRQHGLASAHYWGYADQGLITALKDEPGFEFGVSDEYDRWHSGVRFWEGDDTDINVEEYRRPAWLEGVLMYQEGMQNTHCLVYDLPPNAVRDEDRLDLLLGERNITHIALLRPEPMQSPKAADFSWSHLGGFWLGVTPRARRRPAG